jgi:hypothetical protein
MTLNYDKVKHTAGVIALALVVPAAGWPHGKWIALGLAIVAFIAGVQSEQFVTRTAAAVVPEVKP